MTNNRILIIDDQPEIHADFQKVLAPAPPRNDLAALRAAVRREPASAPERAFTLASAHQGEEGFALAREAREAGNPFAVAFVDMRMPPGWDGLRTMQELWRLDPELQIVLCTAFSDHPWERIENIARDSDRLLVLKKPFEAIEVRRMAETLTAKWSLARRAGARAGELEELVAQRTAELGVVRRRDQLFIAQLESAAEKRADALRRAASHDDLTGLPRRTLFHDTLTAALRQARAVADIHVGVLFIDLDRFKNVNDSLGHHAGDDLLREIAARLSAAVRATDLLAVHDNMEPTASRLGGDEFCLLLPAIRGRDEAQAVAERVLRTIEQPVQIGSRAVRTSASIGIAVSGDNHETAERMVRDADIAMYRAKKAGKGHWVLFDAAMHHEAMRRLTLENDLLHAIERRELRTFYQPIVSLNTGAVLGAEALARWNHAEFGLTDPGEFIRIAEESGFIEALGLWVLEDACTTMARWRRSAGPAARLRLSVNVSPVQLRNPRFAARVSEILERTALAPAALVLEMTENVMMDDASVPKQQIADLRDRGVKFFLDDFGKGYSAMSVLHNFALDGMKIDRAFLSDATGPRRFAAILHAMLNLAQNLGMECVTEGIETIEQVALLQSLGCIRGQGYLFSPPVPAADMETMLQERAHLWEQIREPAA